MTDLALSALPLASLPLGPSDQLYVVQGGQSRRVPASALGLASRTLHLEQLAAARQQIDITVPSGCWSLDVDLAIYNTSGATSSLSCYINNDTTNANYRRGGLYNTSGAPVSEWNISDAFFEGTPNAARCSYRLSVRHANGRALVYAQGNTQVPAFAVNRVISHMVDTAGLTTVSLRSNIANGFSVGTRVAAYRTDL